MAAGGPLTQCPGHEAPGIALAGYPMLAVSMSVVPPPGVG